jgi:CheY-like chemotaxis protein
MRPHYFIPLHIVRGLLEGPTADPVKKAVVVMPAKIPHPSTTILFIDSHDEDRQYWVQRLRTSSPDYVILEASNGAAGLGICDTVRVDCVISELSFPDMSGFEVLLKLVPKPRHPEIAFIFLTRLLLAPMKDFALKNGAQAYLVKSRSFSDDLDVTVHKALVNVALTLKEALA